MSITTQTTAPIVFPLEDARHYHARNQLLQAAESYRQALQDDPRSQPALLGLSLIARQSNQLLPAIHMAQAALAAGPDSSVAWANLGDLLLAMHQTPRAEFAFRRALSLDSTLAVAHYGLGNSLALQENFPAALTSFQTAAQLARNLPELHFAQGFAHSKVGQHSQAISAYRRTITLRPGFASAWLNLGVELIADGRPQLAVLCYRQALASSAPSDATQISTRLNLGHLERGLRHFSQSHEHYNCALALAAEDHPLHAEVQIAFTYLHLEQQEFTQAWQSIQAAESADPTHKNPEIPNARGILLLAEHSAATSPEACTQKIEQAIAAFHEAESRGHKTAASNRGNALLRVGRCTEAVAAHQAALIRSPNHSGVRYNLALTQLRLGDFVQGWQNYEIRWSFREVHPHPRRFRQPRWQGEPLPQYSRMFIYAEQGLGDTIQFCRYLTFVAQHLTQSCAGIHILLEVQPPLTRLLTPLIAHLNSIPGISAEILSHGDPLPHFTHHCPLMSLPAIFQTTLETVPAQLPYLHPDTERMRARAEELPALTNTPAIGLAWAGNPNYRADRERSTRLETFLPLLEISGIRWVSLQKGGAAGQITAVQKNLRHGVSIYDGCSRDQDFADTAALVANLDLIITTDTAVAHLAGALGKPLWLLLPWQSDWRWMQDRLTTPWYPTARLFRQSSPNDWPELIDRVASEISKSTNRQV